MRISTQNIKELKAQVNELGERFQVLKDDQRFTAWFLRAYLTESEEAAVRAITGGAGDKGLDAVLIDDRARCVFAVQTKYRATSPGKAESRGEVIAFANLAHVIASEGGEPYRAFQKGANEEVKQLVAEARRRVTQSNYRLRMYFVTIGSVSTTLLRDAKQSMRAVGDRADLEVLGNDRLAILLRDYLDGAAPPIPTMDLEMEKGQGVTVNGVLQRYDNGNDIESWVFSMRGNAVADLIASAGSRIFARNIRGFMGEGAPVNRDMTSTLKGEPDHFFYYNNGVTIVCDKAEKLSRKGVDVLRVSNPQIINGQQTSRVLAEHRTLSAKASLLVKVIQVPREPDDERNGFDRLISKIVKATNWQTAIKAADLVSNDRRQIDLERALMRLGYGYLRKRQTKGEARAQFGFKAKFLIKKEDLAQAVAGCDLDPVIARSGKDNLFSHEYYETIFPTSDPDYYLNRYWLAQRVSAGSKGYPQRGYMKWLVLKFLWDEVGPVLRSIRNARAFRTMNQRNAKELLSPLTRAINCVYVDATRYYNKNKGRGDKIMDVSLFFRSKKHRDKEFSTFWNRRQNQARRPFGQHLALVKKVIEQHER